MSEAKSGDTVRIHYTGRLTDGTVFDSSQGREPLEFTLGAGQIIAGLEKGIVGMNTGDSSTVEIGADEAYGPHDPAQVQKVPREMIPGDIELEPGVQLGARTPQGEQLSITVVEVAESEVTVDANHPLAGETLNFAVTIVDVRAASEEELDHGHVHGPDGHHHE